MAAPAPSKHTATTVAEPMAAEQPASGKEEEKRLYATVYTPLLLSAFYDWFVLRFNLRYMWRCRTDTVLEPFYAENFSRRHLDIGVATGYFPAAALSRPFRAPFRHDVALVDINPSPLAAASRRIEAAAPGATVFASVAADATIAPPAPLQPRSFDSVSTFNLFHCVPGGPAHKLRAFALWRGLLADGGVWAGCTVLGGRHAAEQARQGPAGGWLGLGWLRYWYLKLYNRMGLFHNWDDTREDFERALRDNFDHVEVSVVGLVLLWRATGPKRD
ncbi:methyltransferase [Xylariaceae sp. FL0804]|nr:methyltransferase [Xylariaceae sp. FL0804]